jgi:hypothetical protein
MLLSEFKDYLRYGELSQVTHGELFADSTDIARLVSHINLGLIELHKRFPIKTSEVVIQLWEHITEYTIHSSNAESQMAPGDDADDFYVKDSAFYPFMDDILQIIQVFNEDGEEIPLNDENKKYSLFTTSSNKIFHPYPDNDNAITLIYQCIAPKLSAATATDATEIDIPQQFAEALLNYVSYRTFSAINMNSPEATNYYAKFEASCALITNFSLTHRSNTTNMKLENSGWV